MYIYFRIEKHRTIENYNYKHFYVNHSKGFVDPDNPQIHTNNIERLWSYLRKYVKRNVRKEDIEVFINYFLWFYHTNRNSRYEILVKILSDNPNLFNQNIK